MGFMDPGAEALLPFWCFYAALKRRSSTVAPSDGLVTGWLPGEWGAGSSPASPVRNDKV
jgi:hypothetical protein